jgi:hypothetical protein
VRSARGATSLRLASAAVDSVLAEVNATVPRWRWSALRRLHALAEELTRRYPDDAESWYVLGEARFHWGFPAGQWLIDLTLPSSVIWALERARVAERLGERSKAIRGYQYVADLWRHADPELQPYVTEAREGLARLTSE